MRTPVNAFALLCTVAALQATVFAGAAAAQDETPRSGSGQWGADRWVPSLSATSGIAIDEWKGDVESQCVGCPAPVPATAPSLRPFASGDDRDVTPFVGGIVELMTPELPIPASPRFFAGGGFLGSFGFDRNLAIEGNPGTLTSPLPPSSEGTTPYGENSMIGQGSKVSAQLQPFLYTAEGGIAFPFELFGRAFRIKPAVSWIQFEVEAKGELTDAECRQSGPQPNPTTAPPTNCNPQVISGSGAFIGPGVLRTIQLEDEDSLTLNGVGGGLDVEMDTIRIGPLGSSLFIGARAYKILGDREIELEAGESFPSAGVPGLPAVDNSARWNMEVDEVVYRASLGLRLQWLGSED